MQKEKVELLERIKRVSGVESFKFKIDKEFNFTPGQFIEIVFDEENRENRNLNKFLSISTGPGKNYIEFTKKLSDSNFSSKLKALKPGDRVLINGPLGKCTFVEGQAKKIGFLVGGIGITPVISIIEYILSNKLSTDVLIIYSNHSEDSIAFKKEMDQWTTEHSNIKILHILGSNDGASKKYLTGIIDTELLKKYAPDLKDRLTYIFGPPKMVTAMKDVCTTVGIEKKKILSESFMGY